jgi:excisionase family DNA binding protein
VKIGEPIAPIAPRFDDCLTVEQVAAKLRFKRNTIYKLIAAGKIPAFRHGRIWRLKAEELAKLLPGKKTFPKTNK